MPSQNKDFMNQLLRSKTSAGQADVELEGAWQDHQESIMALLDEIENLNAVIDMLEDPAANRATDVLDDVVDAALEVVDSTDAVEVALNIEDDLLEPADYEGWLRDAEEEDE
jgi:hypothetical protein